MHSPVVPALAIHRIWTEHLQLAALNLWDQRADHSSVFIFVEPPLRSGKNQQRDSPMSENKHFHLTMQFGAMSFMVFTVHWPQYLTSSNVNWLMLMWRGRPRPRLLRLVLLLILVLPLILILLLLLPSTLIWPLALEVALELALSQLILNLV